jgi:beta-glucanase (GH16 family)
VTGHAKFVALVVGSSALVVSSAAAAERPRIRTITPVNGSTVSGAVRWEARASPKPRRVDFFVDGTLRKTDRRFPYVYMWDTLRTRDGLHRLRARGVWRRVARSSTRRITVANAPPPIARQGYRLTWDDDFNTLDTSKWEQCWYEHDPGPYNIFVLNGMLHLQMRRAEGYLKANLCSIDLSDNRPFNVFRHGYFEARSRVPVGKGAWSAFWLSSEYHARNWQPPHGCPPYWSEIDIYEMIGTQPHTHYTTLHRNTNGRCGIADETRPAQQWMRCDTDTTPCDLRADFHVYAVQWTPDRVRWYRDGQVVQSTRYHFTLADVPAFDSTDQAMYISLGTSPCEFASSTCPDSTSPDVIDHEVDWVRVWTR